MKKKRIMAFAMAGMLCFTSISWASVPSSSSRTEVPAAATGSNAQKKATSSNADGNLRPPVSKAPQKTTVKTETEEAVTAELSASGTAYVYVDYSITAEFSDSVSGSYELQYKAPGSDTYEWADSNYLHNENSAVFDIPHSKLQKTGTYQFQLVDQDDNVCSTTPLSVTVSKWPEGTVLTLSEQVFKKAWQAQDPVMDKINRFSYASITLPNGSEVTRVNLTGISYERAAGEEPGTYAITQLSCDQCDSLKLTENEYSKFLIDKKSIVPRIPDIIVINDEAEWILTIPALQELAAPDLDETKKPDSIQIGELSEDSKAYFSVLPASDGTAIRFTLKPGISDVSFQLPITLENKYYRYGDNLVLKFSVRGTLLTESRTEEEIRDFYESHPFSLNSRTSWEVQPDLDSETAGTLSVSTVNEALNALNFVRFIAGIPADVTNNDDYEALAQAGTTLLTGVGTMTHNPSQPAGVSDAFYEKAKEGTSSSNLGMGYRNLPVAIVTGWMNDGDSSNIATVGHRRWCLDPNMKETGFGHSGSYTAIYAFYSNDHRDERTYDYDYIAWPGRTMPVEYFQGPWSISFSKELYDLDADDPITVTMTSKKTGRTYTLDSSCKSASGKYFNINTGGYGYGDTLIFQPGVSFADGDDVTVSIKGLKDKSGNDSAITYTVHFFAMEEDQDDGGSSSGGGGSSSGGGGGSSSGGGGGSSSGGGGGGGSSSRRSSSSSGPSASLPSYVVRGTWIFSQDGNWKFTDSNGTGYVNLWAAVYNPYANTAAGQSAFDWFRFDGAGNMVAGWFQDSDGSRYYLNSASDGTRGRMLTGWAWIADETGVQKCYYFNPVSDGYRGRMVTNAVIDGYTINANGEWTVDGVVQTR